jgi:hypothetical protein
MSDSGAELINWPFPKPSRIEREDTHGNPVLAQSLDSVKQLPLRSALTERSGNVTDFQF